MRNVTSVVVAVPLALALAACGRNARTTAANEADLQRDLQLASATTMTLPAPQVDPANFDALETEPQSAPRPSAHLVKARGPKAIASAASDLQATRIPQVAATQPVPQVQTVATAPAPVPNQDPVASVLRPSAPPAVPATGVGGGFGRTGSGPGVFGPGEGVVIRGGGLDGDNCEPHGRRRPGGFEPYPGGMGGGTFIPVIRPGGTIFH